MRKLLTRPAPYVLLYLGLVLPTYLLPYLGSNASLLRASARSMGVRDTTTPGLFTLHLACLATLCGLALVRGGVIGRRWLVGLPALALVFDLTPGLSLLPLVPTLLHVGAVAFGAADRPSTGRPA